MKRNDFIKYLNRYNCILFREGAKHTWPGVENESYEEIAGETNEDINAGEELWNFFNKYELCLSGSAVEEKNAAGMKVFPNPASEYIEIRQPSEGFKPSEGSNIKIYNSFGECVMELPDVQHLGDVGHLKR